MFFLLSSSSLPLLALRCFVMFAVWTGPIPYLHCHGALDSVTGTGYVQLAKHLSRHHKCDSSCIAKSYSWHFHLAVPTGEEEGTIPPSQCLSADGMTTNQSSDWDDCQLAASLAHPFLQDKGMCVAPVADSVFLSRGFYDSYARTLPLPMRFSVVRC
ncbi:hypothetical protein DTL42_01650 [Bremerella cremea]|uniref:Uncharacterized protein n=1 Tax=Bremerella cremea TaxID=1031537 RepID=A0A368KU43_9BACT|nr:hypothetical protein [Bremerella cremea]RCS53899.1 hypothetical protein DTL42_01650 [Bremerella cremea]